MTAKDLTPLKYRCAISAACPSVHQLDDGRLEIVGELVEIIDTVASASGHQVKTAEARIRIPVEYFSELMATYVNYPGLKAGASEET